MENSSWLADAISHAVKAENPEVAKFALVIILLIVVVIVFAPIVGICIEHTTRRKKAIANEGVKNNAKKPLGAD